jgi:hypothetical protein
MRQAKSVFSESPSVSDLLVTGAVAKDSPSRLPHFWETKTRTAVQLPPLSRVLCLLALAVRLPYGQVSVASPPGDPTARSGTQQAPGTSSQKNQSQQPNQSQHSSPPSREQNSGQATPESQLGGISGTVTDVNDAGISGATVVLEGPSPGDRRTAATNDNGFFEISNVKPGISYHVTITATGFANWTSTFILDPGQYKILKVRKLPIEEVQTSVTVRPETTLEIATEQVKVAESQRMFGFIPNFFAVYIPNPAPLTAKLKFRLAFKAVIDPGAAAGIALLAGGEQARGTPDYGGGMKGYGERFGSIYANQFTSIVIGGAVLPSLLHQDPRYFYQGTGTKRSRALHAISHLIVSRGDNGHLQPNYSSLGGDLASAAISNAYYPGTNRGVGLVWQNFAINTGVHLAVRLLQEFVFHPKT